LCRYKRGLIHLNKSPKTWDGDKHTRAVTRWTHQRCLRSLPSSHPTLKARYLYRGLDRMQGPNSYTNSHRQSWSRQILVDKDQRHIHWHQLHISHLVQHSTVNINPFCQSTLRVKKTRHQTLVHNFAKYWPIFKILSLLHSTWNLQCKDHYRSLKTIISQGSVATPFRCGEICNDLFIANFLLSITAKEFKKSVNIWWRQSLVLFFWLIVYYCNITWFH